MALAQYSDVYWFPNGALAANVTARVFPLSSPALASLYTDVTGGTPLPNPTSTNGAGVLTFWAEEGEYWVHIDNRSFRISVGSPGNLDTFEAAASTLSTGVVYGGQITVNGLNPLAIDIPDTVGYVVDHVTDPIRPTTTRVHRTPITVALADLTQSVTWWFINAAGAVTQQITPPTAADRRTKIFIGATAYDGIGAIVELVASPQILSQGIGQMNDLFLDLGPFGISGNTITPNGANLMLNCSTGSVFAPSWAYAPTPLNPHSAPTLAQTPMFWTQGLSTSLTFPPPQNTFDPANYDNGGVLTPVGGGVNSSTVQRVFKFAADTANRQTTIQYGQTVYPNLTAALNSIGQTNYIVNPQFTIGALVAWIVTIRTATNLSDPAQCVIVPASKFDRP